MGERVHVSGGRDEIKTKHKTNPIKQRKEEEKESCPLACDENDAFYAFDSVLC